MKCFTLCLTTTVTLWTPLILHISAQLAWHYTYTEVGLSAGELAWHYIYAEVGLSAGELAWHYTYTEAGLSAGEMAWR